MHTTCGYKCHFQLDYNYFKKGNLLLLYPSSFVFARLKF